MIPSAIRASVRDYIRANQIFNPGRLVVAVSGGADSTALLLVLADLADEFGLVLHIAHFDHRTRPRQSAQDADFAAKLAGRVGAPIRVGRADKPTRTEDEARTARYEFLRRCAREIGAAVVATGHTRDDQAETVLLHLARGSGIAGLAAMRPLRDGIARPLLTIGREDTLAVCRAVHIRPRADPTNRSLKFARNRVRLRVIPELQKINPRAVDAIARLADAAASVQGDADEAIAAALGRAMRGDHIALDELDESPLRAEILALAWGLATSRSLSARHRAALAQLVSTTDGSASLDLPGGRAVREYAVLRIEEEPRKAPSAPESPLAEGKEVLWNDWRFVLGSSPLPNAVETRVPTELLQSLVVRARRPGDRIGTANGKNGKKVQDVFVDRKVPASVRDRWPLVVVADRVWWIPGLTEPPYSESGTRLAVAGPAQIRNVLWTSPVRRLASDSESAASPRPRRGRKS